MSERISSKNDIISALENDSVELVNVLYLESETVPQNGFRTYEWNGLIIITLMDKNLTKPKDT